MWSWWNLEDVAVFTQMIDYFRCTTQIQDQAYKIINIYKYS